MKLGGDNAEHKENINRIFTAQFATHEEILLLKLDSTYRSSDYDQKWEKWYFCDVPLNFVIFDLKF